MREFASPQKKTESSTTTSGVLHRKPKSIDTPTVEVTPAFGPDFSKVPVTSRQAAIETTAQAVSHYFSGKGISVDIGINSINTLLGTNDFLFRHQRITNGLTSSLTGNFSVDLTREILHIGRTNVDYSVTCDGDTCTVTYTLFVNDGFWDADFIDENTLGRLGHPSFKPDGPGPNLERLGGTPFAYNPTKRSFTFKNPGYKPSTARE